MPNTLHGPFAPITIAQGSTPVNKTWGDNAQKQSSTALASFNPDLIGSGFILSGVAASRHNNYASNVLADTPTHYYRLGEASGALAAVDSNVGTNAFSMAYNNSPTLGASGLLTGDADTAATFASASSQYVAGAFTAGMPSGAGTVSLECWIKFAANPASTQFIVNIGDRAVATHSLALVLLNTGAVQLSNGTTVISSAALTTGTRHHLVGTYDGTNLRLYVDNVLVAGPTAATNALGYVGNTVTIASQSGATPGSYFDGTIDEVAIYVAALSATRVTAHWTAGTTATTQVDVGSGTAYLLQSDGTPARCDVVATNFTTVTISTTYFLDLNPDGSWSWGTSHSGVANHLTIASVATDSSGNTVTVTDTRPLNVTLLPNLTGTLSGVARVLTSTGATPVHITTTSPQQIVLSITAPATGFYRANLSFYVGGTVPASISAAAKYFGGNNPGINNGMFFSTPSGALNAFSIAAAGENATEALTFYAAGGTTILVYYTNATATPNDYVSAVIERLA